MRGKRLISSALSLALVAPACGSESTQGNVEERLAEARSISAEFIGKYGCAAADLNIVYEDQDVGIEYSDQSGEVSVFPAESPEPGELILYPFAVYDMTDDEFDFVVWHEMTHVCRGEKVAVETQFEIDDATTLTGIDGLNFHFVFNDNPDEEQRFTLIEEAVADYIARQESSLPIEENLSGYSGLADMIEYYALVYDISAEELQNYSEKSDLFGFIRRIYGLGENDPVDSGLFEGFLYEVVVTSGQGF